MECIFLIFICICVEWNWSHSLRSNMSYKWQWLFEHLRQNEKAYCIITIAIHFIIPLFTLLFSFRYVFSLSKQFQNRLLRISYYGSVLPTTTKKKWEKNSRLTRSSLSILNYYCLLCLALFISWKKKAHARWYHFLDKMHVFTFIYRCCVVQQANRYIDSLPIATFGAKKNNHEISQQYNIC